MKSYLVSWLRRQHAGTGVEAFARERPGEWIVWEAGPWRPPTPMKETLHADDLRVAWESGESLAILLAPRPGRAEVRLGRASDNDVVIDDATLSRSHLAFVRDAAGRWTVRDLGSSNGTRVGGVRMGAAPAVLEAGTAVQAGAVRLTFYDAAGLYLRLKGAR
ncbi:FHA domain-containing protein [Anaeromyxobacter oryzae]|uniref:FHA domain-containing protein n=1 Tax=Anaeromyxobacter oryzae TaxID=2918170 RepID=UPI0020BDB53C|nr:FHA domain-containing protein [Anaeromyxobacter oryzae]